MYTHLKIRGDVYMRKDIFERMRFFVKEDIKPNFSQIARQYGVDRRTAKTLYDKTGQVKEVVRKKRNIHGKLDDFKEIVMERKNWLVV